MILPVYSVRDNKSMTFGSPILSNNDFVVLRSWAEALHSGADRIQSFVPKDFDMYKIGEFDVDKGQLIPCVPIVLVGNAAEVMSNYEER